MAKAVTPMKVTVSNATRVLKSNGKQPVSYEFGFSHSGFTTYEKGGQVCIGHREIMRGQTDEMIAKKTVAGLNAYETTLATRFEVKREEDSRGETILTITEKAQ